MTRRRTRAQHTQQRDSVSSTSSEGELKTTKDIINQLSTKYKKSPKTSTAETSQGKKGGRKSPAVERRKSSRLSAKEQEEGDDYQADVENNDSSSQSTDEVKSPSADLYDFSTSEDDFKLEYTPDEPVVKKTARTKKATKKTLPKAESATAKILADSQKPNSVLYKLKGVGKPSKTQKKVVQTEIQSRGVKRSSDTSFKAPDAASFSAKKRKGNSQPSGAFDSGVFMTPSPVQGSTSSTFHLSFDSGKAKVTSTSTPSCILNDSQSKGKGKYIGSKPLPGKGRFSDPLSKPPDLSPVKKFVSPNTGGVHGALVTSPQDDATPAGLPASYGSPTLKKKRVEAESSLIGEDEEPYKALDISKTYGSVSEKNKVKRKATKTKKQGRYSMSKYEEWADKKATEFDEIENFELSIESC